MSRQLLSRNDRVAQMTKQEELIVKKKREILEKQKTAELVKAIAANMPNTSGVTTPTQSEKSAPDSQKQSICNTFNNDGSFLENFKKVTEAHMINFKKSEDNLSESSDKIVEKESEESLVTHESDLTDDKHVLFFNMSPSNASLTILPTSSSAVFNPSIPPPITANTQYTPLHSIPRPKPISLNEIPPPKDFDLNTIPKPELNLDAIKIPELSSVSKVFSDKDETTALKQFIEIVAELGDAFEDCFVEVATEYRSKANYVSNSLGFLFTKNSDAYHNYREQVAISRQDLENFSDIDINNDGSSRTSSDGYKQKYRISVEKFTELVAEYGDAMEDCFFKYADRIPSQSIEISLSFWTLLTKGKHSDSYREYRDVVAKLRAKKHKDQENKYDPTDMYNINKDDDEDNDSDYEYMKETKKRNLINMKRKLTTKRNECYSTDSDDDDDDDDEEDDEKYEQQRNKSKENTDKGSESSDSKPSKNKKNKKSRWGEKIEILQNRAIPSAAGTSFENQSKPLLKRITKTDPGLLQYARQNFGTTELSEEDWKKAEEHYKINLLYQDMLKKREEIDRLAKTGKFKYEYDSDEDTTGGTWEHKLRSAEMEATQIWAEALNKQSEGKHHIGDFLPPEELKKFMEQYDAKKNNREPDLSDYKEYKLKEDNIGFQLLQKLGWKEGQGLGAEGSGIVDPINK